MPCIGGSEACKVCFGRTLCPSQCENVTKAQIILSASDLHNTRTTILNPFYNTGYKMIKKIRQKSAVNRIGHFMHKSHPQSVKCTCPSHSLRHQWRHNASEFHDITIATKITLLPASERKWNRNLSEKCTDRHSNIVLFRHVQWLNCGCLTVFMSTGIRCHCLSKIWRIYWQFYPAVSHNHHSVIRKVYDPKDWEEAPSAPLILKPGIEDITTFLRIWRPRLYWHVHRAMSCVKSVTSGNPNTSGPFY